MAASAKIPPSLFRRVMRGRPRGAGAKLARRLGLHPNNITAWQHRGVPAHHAAKVRRILKIAS